jgi:peptide/nickel transport system permease protein
MQGALAAATSEPAAPRRPDTPIGGRIGLTAELTSIPETRPRRALPWARLGRWPIVPIILLAPVVICGLFGPWIWPHDPTGIDFAHPLKPPAWMAGGSWTNFLGTDQFGRDLLSRLIEGARITLEIAVISSFASAIIGIPAGLISGYYGGKIDNFIMRIVDTELSIPPVLLTILIGGALGGGVSTIIISIIFVFWTTYARVIRGETLVIRQKGFIALAHVADCSGFRILFRHIFPNVLPTCVVLFTLQIGVSVIIEAAITFIGLGVQPPATAWGLLISEGRNYLSTAWWIPTFAGVAITITVLGANLLGDWLRDALDPKLRQM